MKRIQNCWNEKIFYIICFKKRLKNLRFLRSHAIIIQIISYRQIKMDFRAISLRFDYPEYTNINIHFVFRIFKYISFFWKSIVNIKTWDVMTNRLSVKWKMGLYNTFYDRTKVMNFSFKVTDNAYTCKITIVKATLEQDCLYRLKYIVIT